MSNKLDELEIKIQQLFDAGNLHNSRAVFDIGVQFGKLLQSENIQNYEFLFWKKLDEENNSQNEINRIIDSIDKFLLFLVKKSIKEHVDDIGTWSISKGNTPSDYAEFSNSIIEKYFVQITSVGMTEYGGNFECKFQIVGTLSEIFKANNIFNIFEVSFDNDYGNEYLDISDTNLIDKKIFGYSSYIRNVNNWNAEEYLNFYHTISKDFLFDILNEI